MWIETIEGYIANSDTLEKIEINYPNTSVSHSKAEPIRVEVNMEEMSEEEREELRCTAIVR